jgi:solute carrier family 25, member 42
MPDHNDGRNDGHPEIESINNKNNNGPRIIHRSVALGERRNTIPIELDFPDDCAAAVGSAFDEQHHQQQHHLNHHLNHPFVEMVGTATSREEEEKSNPLHRLPKELRNVLAGGVAGIIAKSVVAPVDRIKIMYQISNATFRLVDVPTVARKIVQSDGILGLWKGNSAAMIRVFPYSGIQFMVFDVCKQYFIEKRQHIAHHSTAESSRSTSDTESNQLSSHHHNKGGLLPMESLVAGMIAGCISVLCTYPLDLTRAQLAVVKKTEQRQTFVTMFWENYRLRGVTGLFRGITPTLIGILPYSGIAFALNEQGKRQVGTNMHDACIHPVCNRLTYIYSLANQIQHWANREATTIERMQCGALAGLVAQTVTYPIEVTRRRMQTLGLVGIHNDSALTALGCQTETTPRTLLQTVRHLFHEQGFYGFLKGVSMNWIKGPIAFSISFTTYDSVQRIMESPLERSRRLSQLHR